MVSVVHSLPKERYDRIHIMSNLTDEQLVVLVREGNAEHFSELYNRYIDKIYRFIYVSLRHKENSEDITSKVFMRSFEKIKTYQSKSGPFGAWIYGIARNALIDHYRSSGRENVTDSLPELPHDARIEKDIDISNSMKKLDAIMSQFDDDVKQILTLRLWEEMSFADIAQLLNKSEGAIKMSFYRSVTKLKDQLTIALMVLTNMLMATFFRS